MLNIDQTEMLENQIEKICDDECFDCHIELNQYDPYKPYEYNKVLVILDSRELHGEMQANAIAKVVEKISKLKLVEYAYNDGSFVHLSV